MSIVDIADSKPTPKPVVIFGSAIDLAHGLLREWSSNNKALREDCEEAYKFLIKTLESPPKERNFIDEYFFLRKINKHRRSLRKFVEELRFITVEIEDLIGNASFLKAGLKSKIKNKKQFDDAIIRFKEFTIMLLNITTYIANKVEVEGNFAAELALMKEVRPHISAGYYDVEVYRQVGAFYFK
jgi:hypothetical protein